MQAQWSIQVTTRRKIEDNVKVVFSMIPSKALKESGVAEPDFWEDIRKKLIRKAYLEKLPPQAVNSYIIEAGKNRSNEVSLVIEY